VTNCDPTVWSLIWQAASPLAILFGAVVAILAMCSNRNTSRQRAAIEYLSVAHENQRLKDCIISVRKLHHDPDVNIESFAYPAKRDSDESDDIRYLMNHFEYLSVGIGRKIYDEETIKAARYTVIVQVWTMCSPFVLKVREQDERKTLYQEFEELAERWKLKPLQVKS